MSKPINQYIQTYAAEITSKFRRLNHLVKHNPSIGSYHESVMRSFLRGFLTGRCGIKTGFVYNSETDLASKQIDILVIDESDPAPYYFAEGDFVVARPECVIAAIEVKSSFSKAEFCSSIENGISFRKTSRYGRFLIFAYEMLAVNEETVAAWYQSINDSDNEMLYPSSIYALNKGVFNMIRKEFHDPWGHVLMVPLDDEEDLGTFTIAHLLSSITQAAQQYAGKKSTAFQDYTTHAKFLKRFYRFGQGALTPAPARDASDNAA